MDEARSTYGERSCICRVLVEKPEGKRTLGKPRRKWKYNIKMDIKESGMWDMGWIHLAQDRGMWRALMNAVMVLRVQWNAGNFLIS